MENDKNLIKYLRDAEYALRFADLYAKKFDLRTDAYIRLCEARDAVDSLLKHMGEVPKAAA